MILLTFFTASPSRALVAAITDRFASLDRLNEALATHAVGERLPVPARDPRGPFGLGEAATRDVIGLVCSVPHEPCAMFAGRSASGSREPVTCPVESDLDAEGVCRCGCGFVRGVS